MNSLVKGAKSAATNVGKSVGVVSMKKADYQKKIENINKKIEDIKKKLKYEMDERSITDLNRFCTPTGGFNPIENNIRRESCDMMRTLEKKIKTLEDEMEKLKNKKDTAEEFGKRRRRRSNKKSKKSKKSRRKSKKTRKRRSHKKQ